jgi:putative endonuclease
MNDNLQNAVSDLIEKYVVILEKNGEPNEQYKYSAIDTFQQNWDLEAEDFSQMFLNSFKGRQNLLFHNSWGFIEKLAKEFPKETREMFRNLYDESIDVSRRIEAFQRESENLLPKLQQRLNKFNIKTLQDERTISLYLVFRYPEKYILYKYDYYKNFCKKLGFKEEKVRQRFLHLQKLADEIKQSGILEDERLKSIYQKIYSKPDWDDTYMKLQNVLYVTFKEEMKNELKNLLKKFNRQQLEEYYSFLDSIIERFGLQEGDERLVFNVNKEGQIVFTIGQRYVWITDANEKSFKFEVISEEPISNKSSDFDGKPTAFWNKFNNISDVLNQQQTIFSAIEKELNRAQKSSYFKHNKKELEKMAFDADFRKEVLDQLKTITITDEPMEKPDKTSAIPLNQILFGAPGTGKTYHTKKMAVEIINGKKAQDRSREEINEEYEQLIEAGQIVFTTFHQSLSYEDFIEGIKPETIDGNVTYEVKDGIFKSICKNAFSKEITSDNFEVVYQKLLDEIDNSVDNKLVLETLVHAKEFTIYKNSKNNIRFHSNTEKANEAVIKKEVLKHYLKTGEALDWAPYTKSVANYIIEKYNYIQNEVIETKNHVLIIDEINRGNVSAIFGELITLLEEDKRKGNPEHTEVKLPYSGDNFSVPNNVYIIGTMNTADRSVEALDTALRRRFSFVEMQPNPEILSKVEDVDLKELLKTINKRIEVLIDKDHQIGHSYFIGIQDLEDLRRTVKDKIIPLLEEYFYGDFGKIGLVLGEKFIKQTKCEEKEFAKFPYEKDFLEDKKIYHITSSDKWNDDAFKSIYGELEDAK